MSTQGIRENFDRQLQKLENEVLVLGSMVEQATLGAVDALKKRDSATARLIYKADQRINDKRFQLETTCVALIAMQQPMARDLRFLTGVLEIITELERMGDYAKHIARICVLLEGKPLVKPLVDIPRMAELGVSMLNRALAAFVKGDVEAARAIPNEDVEVDQLYNQVQRELITYMIADTTLIDRANLLLWVAHNLERFADRVTNICERTIFVATGVLKELDRSDDELVDGYI